MLEPTTYSLVNYREAERVVAEYNAIAARAESDRTRRCPPRIATPSTSSCSIR